MGALLPNRVRPVSDLSQAQPASAVYETVVRYLVAAGWRRQEAVSGEKSRDEWEREYDDAVQCRDWQTCDQLLAEREGLSWWPVGEDTE